MLRPLANWLDFTIPAFRGSKSLKEKFEIAHGWLVDVAGIEPATPCLQSQNQNSK
jgi:hypothetical protein